MKNKEYISLTKMIEYVDKSLKYTAGYTIVKETEAFIEWIKTKLRN